jgi:hypothetical protein
MSALAYSWLRGTQNPHVLTCTLRFLRSVRPRFSSARHIFKSTLVCWLNQSLQNRHDRIIRTKTRSLMRDIPLQGRRAASEHATKRMKRAVGLGGLVR